MVNLEGMSPNLQGMVNLEGMSPNLFARSRREYVDAGLHRVQPLVSRRRQLPQSFVEGCVMRPSLRLPT